MPFPAVASRHALRRLGGVLVGAAIAIAAVATTARAQATYTYNGSGSGAWNNASSWTPSRNSPQTTDVLVIDGNVTASPTVTNVQTQTIGRLRVVNGADVVLEANSNGRVLTLSGTGTPALEIAAGASVHVTGTRTIEITLAGASTGAIAGQVLFEDQGHRLTAATAGAITFASGSSFSTLAGFRGNPFGNSGTAGIVVFAAGSSYLHNAGDGPFGLAAPASRAVFQDGSTYVVRTASTADVAGRTLANLTVENSVSLTTSSAASFGVQTLLVRTGCAFAYTGSGASAVQVRGDLTIAGTGTIALTAGSGGIQVNGGVVQTVGPSAGTGSVSFGSPATVANGTTLVLARALANGSQSTTVNGTLELEAAGAISGPVVYGPGASLVFDTGATAVTVNTSSPYWPAANGPTNVAVRGVGGINLGAGATRTVPGTVVAAGPIANAQRLTVGGTLRIEAPSPLSGSPTYLAGATLHYGLGTHAVGAEWATGSVVGVGVAEHVVFDPGPAGSVATPAQDRYVPGDVRIASGTLVLNPGGGNLLLRGDWLNQGTLVPNDRTIVFQGTAHQTVERAGGETFDVLQIDKPAGGTVTLLSSLTTRLAFLDGIVATGANELVLKPGGSLTRAAGWVDGTLRKPAAAGLTFEVGQTAYAPVSVTLAGLGGAGTVAASTRTPDPANLASSVIDPARTANRSWLLSSSGATFTTAAATFTFVPGDLDPGADPLAFGVVRRDGGVWTEAAAGARTPTSTQATGLTALGEFAVGQLVPHTITASAGPGGSIAPAGTVTVERHGSQQFTIAADAHYALADVLVDGVSQGPVGTYTFTDVVADHTIAATFAVDRHTVGVTVAGNGTVTRTPDQADYPWGSTVRLQAFPAPNHHFVSWTGDTAATANPLDLPVLDDREVTATFAIDMHPLTTNLVGGGSVTRSPNQTSFAHGTVVQLNAYPAPGFAFAGWSGDASGTSNPVLVTMNGPRTVTATFTSASYPVEVTAIGPGTIVRNPDLASYPYGSLVQLTATPDSGASFVGWTGSVTGASNPITLTVDGAENVFATFASQLLDYTVTHADADWQPIAASTGAVPVLVAAHDSTRSVPLPFDFPYYGTVYRTNHHLAINANGYAYFARWPVTQTHPAGSSNQNLFSPAEPNATLAPWYDDLTVAPAGPNPAGAVLVQTLGDPGARRMIVQWTQVSSWFNEQGGVPRRLTFQLQLHEATGAIEFHYGPPVGAERSRFESASIGIEDSTGGNNHYVDGITGSRLTSFGMLTTDNWPERTIRFTPGAPAPVPGGTYDVGPAAAYRNLNEAFRDLNQRGVAGPVTLNLVAATYDTTAAGGDHVFPLLLGPVSGASAARPITIAGNGATVHHRGNTAGVCGNQALTGAIGVVNEPVIGLVGADHVTIANLSVTGGLEADRGVLLLNSSRSDGASHATLSDLSVQLERANPNSIGIQQHALLVPTSLDGTNSNNRYRNLTVTNAYSGIALTGNGSLFDVGCSIGGAGGGRTVIGGPSPGDIGGGPAAVFGVRAVNQADLVVADTDVRSLAAAGSGNVDGIAVEGQGVLTTGQGTLQIARNRISGLSQSSFVGGRVAGIRVAATANPTSVIRVFNNAVHGLTSASTSTASRRVVGILAQEATNGAGGVIEVDFNSVRLEPAGLFSSNACFELGTTNGPVVRVRNNIFANLTSSQSGSARHYAWVSAGATLGPAGSASDRNVLYVPNAANGFTGRVGGADRATLDQWRAAAAADANSRAEDPRFVGATDLHLSTTQATPAEGIASFFNGAITWVGTDIDGDARHATTPDAGADEGDFIPLDLHDLAATSIGAPPADSLLVGGVPFVVRASFLNRGILDQTNAPVRLQILGPLPATTIVHDQVATIPSIVNGATVEVSFPPATVPSGGVWIVRARAELPNDQRRSNDSTEVEVEVADRLAGDYWVGAGRPAPFTTLTDAVARLNYVGVVGPVRFLLEDASYGPAETFPIVVGRPPGVSAAQTVTFQPAPGVTAVVAGSSPSALLVLDGSDHVTIEGANTIGGSTRNLMLQNADASGASAVVWARSAGADGVTQTVIRNLRIQGSGSSTLVGVGYGGPAIALNSDGVGHAGNRVENVLVERAQVGVYVAGSPGAGRSPGVVVTRNSLDAIGANQLTRFGILARHLDGVEVTENRIAYLSGGANGAIGIALGLTTASVSSFTGDEVVNAMVSRNRVDQIGAGVAGAAGIAVARTTTGTTTIVNNMVSRVASLPGAGGVTAGILAGGGATRIWFNSVSMTGDRAGAAGPSYALAVADSTSPIEVLDNVLVNAQTGGPRHAIGVVAGLSFAALASNFNDLHVPGGPLAQVGGLAAGGDGSLPDLAAWRARTGRDASSISADPLFLGAANLHVSSPLSPIANAGQVLAGVTVDHDGETGGRATRPDIGADEFTSWSLGVTVAGQGTVVRAPDQHSYAPGTVVQLTALPATGWHFTGWSGAASGTANPVDVLMDGHRDVVASFAINTYALAVNVVGSGAVARTPDQPLYDHGTGVTLTATPAVGWHFVGWTGDAAGATNPVTLTMDAAKNVTATFAINTYALTVNVAGNGTVARVPDQPLYDHGTVVTLTATPAEGWHFTGWSGAATGTANPLAVTMDAAKTIAATFAINTYSLGVTVNGQGSVVEDPDQPVYDHGTLVTLTAVPDPGHHFEEWSGDLVGSDNPATLAMTANRNVFAMFAINTYPLSLASTGNGTVARSPNSGQYPHGTIVTVTATPAVGWHLARWSGDASGTQNPLQVTMDGAKTITAEFEINTYDLQVTATGNGFVQIAPELESYPHGTSVTLTPVANTGSHFHRWTGDASGSAAPLTFVMDGSRTIVAEFVLNSYDLTVNTVGNGAVARQPNLAAYVHGTTVRLTANPAAGHHFTGWSGDLGGSANPDSVVMTAHRTVTASFAINTYALAVSTVGNGAVTRTPDQAAYDHGTVVQLRASAAVGWHFVGWSGDTTAADTTLAIAMTGPRTLTATFAIDTHPLNVTVVGQGAVARAPDQPLYDHGTVVALTATPAVGWHFVGWSGAATGGASPVNVTMDGLKNVTATFAIDTHPVTVTVVGPGTVARSPDQPLYDYGTTVTLTPQPAPNHHFVAWSGDATGSTAPLAVLVDGPKAITATFTIDTWPLDVTVAGSGSVSRSPDQPAYDHGTVVTLTATPAVGWHFVGWSGAVTDTAAVTTVTMTQARAVTATFAIDTHPLEVTVTGPGSVDRNPNQALYDYGTVVTLTAVPATYHHLAGWSGDLGGTTNPATVTMHGPRAVHATFAIDTHPLTVGVAGDGAVAKSPDQPAYAHGTPVTLTATPATGWHFVGWSGDTTAADPVLVIPITHAREVVATFAIDTHALSTSVVGSGSVLRSPDAAAYDYGTVVTLTAVPATGWHFTGWSGDASGTTSPVAVTMTAPRSVTATFAIDTYALSVSATGSGSVSRNPDQPLYDYGTEVTLTATAAPGWHLERWTGDASGAANPLVLTMDGPKTVTAEFVLDHHPLDVTVVGAGTVLRSPDLGAGYPHGTVVQLTAKTPVGWTFTGWSGDTTATDSVLVLTMNRARALTATFTIKRYTLNVSADANGTVHVEPGQALYDHGTSVVLTAIPSANYQLVGWTGDASGTQNPLAIVMDGDKAIGATFAVNTYSLDVAVTGTGSVVLDPDQPVYAHGQVVQLTATAGPNWHFVGWSGDASGSANPTTVTMNGPRTVTATFAIDTYPISISVLGNGVVARQPALDEYPHGSTVQLTAQPAVGWSFRNWGGALSGSQNPVTLTMLGPRNVTANFEMSRYTVTLSKVGNGNVTKSPNQATYLHGSTVTVSANPAGGYRFAGWSGDTTGTANPFSVILHANKTYVANFVENQAPTVQVTDPNGGETVHIGAAVPILWTAADNVGVSDVDLLLSRTGPTGPWEPLATQVPNTGSWSWTVTGPVTSAAWIRAVARDAAGNSAADVSDAAFTIANPTTAVEGPATEFALAAPTPNPARGAVRVRFAVPREARVRLTVADVQGREVAVLADGTRAPGWHEVRWAGGTAPGIYFVRFEGGGRRQVRRLVVSR